jgi:pyrimidine-specific ribonucleoside hydrolase
MEQDLEFIRKNSLILLSGDCLKIRYSFLIIITMVLILSGGNVSTSVGTLSSQVEISVIVDIDAAPNDWASILYLLKHPAITVLGITVSCGVSYIDSGVINTLGILEHLGINDIPVAAGKETPLVVNHTFPTPWRDGSHNFYGLDLPTTSLQPSSMNASELIISLIEGSEANVTLITLGPLTNVAIALNTEPSIKSKIDEILIMGGAIDAQGNVGLESAIPNYVAEWNIWIDPHAADIVMKSGLPIRMITLDATNQVPRTQAFLDTLESVMTTPEAHLLFDMTTPGLYWWDPLTAVALTNPEVITLEERCIEIIVNLENHEGMTNSTDAGCANALVAVSADASLFEDLFIGYINDDLPSASTPTETTSEFPMDPLLLIAVGSGFVILVLVVFVAMKRR